MSFSFEGLLLLNAGVPRDPREEALPDQITRARALTTCLIQETKPSYHYPRSKQVILPACK